MAIFQTLKGGAMLCLAPLILLACESAEGVQKPPVRSEFGQTDIRPTANNANSIITLIKDDGFYNSTVFLCELYKEFGLTDAKVGEALISSKVDKAGEGLQKIGTWDDWRALNAMGCLDVINHTKNHVDLTKISAEDLSIELDESQATIERELSINVITAVVPMGARNEAVVNKIKEKHWSLKGGWPFPGYNDLTITDQQWYELAQQQTNEPMSELSTMIGWIDHTIQNNKFLVISTHHCTGPFEPEGAWGIVPCEYWRKFMTHLTTKYESSEYWFTGTPTATRYITERQNTRIEILSTDAKEIRLTLDLDDKYPNEIFNYPLLLRTKVPHDWKKVSVAQAGHETKDVITKIEDGVNYVYYHAIPDEGDVVIHVAK